MTLRLSARARRLITVLAFSTVVGLAAAKLNTSGDLQVGGATTRALVDYPDRSIVQRRALPQHVSALQKRAALFARLMATRPVLERIGDLAGVPPDEISALARTTGDVPTTLTEPGSEERANQIRASRFSYHLEIQSDPVEPILAIYSKAPSAAEAERVGNASIAGLRDYLHDLGRRQGFPEEGQARVRQLGAARGGVINGHAALVIGGLTFMVAFGLAGAISLALIHVRRPRSRPAASPAHTPSEQKDRRRRDDWPRTSRVLPWMLAAFIAMLWLVPFNTIELAASLPIDLKLDRLLLPFLAAALVLAYLAGGKQAPRLNITPIHVALGLFVACAVLSVVLDARDLNQSLELDLAVKKLPLLVGYVSLFVIVASAVRPTEVRPFMTYTLVLAVVCALGIIWEYRTGHNLFNTWSERLLPGGFTFANEGEAGTDSLGRLWIAGPGEAGLEAVSMLALALPIALVGLMRSGPPKGERLLYGLAACALIAGMFATGRKSAVLAPLAILITLAYFRRRELLKLAPIGLVVALVVTTLAPGAVHVAVSQFLRPDAASLATTSDRTADYDAIRPDVWTHLLFGRGYGSYNHETYRILDSEILSRTVEMGVVGLAAFLLVGISVVVAARPAIAGRDPTVAPLALIGAAAAVCFLVVSTLFDVLSFPHATYIFLYMTGLVAVVLGRHPELDAAQPTRAHGGRLRRVRPHLVRRAGARRVPRPD
jgi:hypothetical protein